MSSKKNRANKADRAKLFQPFDPLKGFNKYHQRKRTSHCRKKELSPDDYYELNWKIEQVKIGAMIEVVYFNKDQYVSLEELVSKIDLELAKAITIVKKTISLQDIIKISYML